MKKAFLAGLVLTTFGVTAALAGVIEDRQAIMKSFNDTGRTLGGMSRGQAPYDAAAAAAGLKVLSDGAAKLPTLFPAGSDQSTDPNVKTLALPAVWSDTPGFLAAASKFAADVKVAQATTDAAGFTAAYTTVQGDCGGCHKTYRAQPPRPAGPPPGATPPAQ